jgi:hypothetical protein
MMPETVLCWRWAPQPGYRSSFGPETVNTLRAMVARHYHRPHRFVCVTDDTAGIDPRVEVMADAADFAGLASPHGRKNPSCYRRLRMFQPDIARQFGARFVSLDLDLVLTGDMTPVWDRPEPIVLFGDTNPQPGSHYNGSMILMTAGCRPFVWTEFDPLRSPDQALQGRCWGSDQGWLSYRLGAGEAKFTRADGVYSYRNDLKPTGSRLPAGAKAVVFHGADDPWGETAQRLPWVREHYTTRAEVAA